MLEVGSRVRSYYHTAEGWLVLGLLAVCRWEEEVGEHQGGPDFGAPGDAQQRRASHSIYGLRS